MPFSSVEGSPEPAHAGERARVAVVTGGARGIGAALAERLAAEGWSVVAADIAPDPGLEPPAGVELWQLDVTDHEQSRELMGRVVAERGAIDLLVNNAGITRAAPLTELSWADWSAVVDVNLHGVFNCLQAAGRHMLAAGHGVIINISSVSAERGQPGRTAYSATKAAINGLTRAAAVEWAERGVRVNAVGPGYIATGVYTAAVAAGKIREADVLRRTPARRLGTIDEVADAVVFLASDAASFINGQVLYVDGGFLADFGVPPAQGAPAT
jgi:3-oxoacyl-[acyl-carrier protein] reductase